MRLQIFRIGAIALPALSLLCPIFAQATVITVDLSGKYQTEEAKDFRQRDVSGEAAAPQITDISLDQNAISEPFIARIVPSSPETIQATAPKTEITPGANTALIGTKTYEAIIQEAALKNPHLDVALIKAVIATESNYNVAAVSQKGAMGLMQLMPETAERHGVTNPFDPAQNIQAGASELNTLMDNNANISLALAAYNAGQAAVTKHKGIPPYKETQNYVVKVLTKTFHNRQKAQVAPALASGVKSETDAAKNNDALRPMKVYSFDW